jgi:hypothetical protein
MNWWLRYWEPIIVFLSIPLFSFSEVNFAYTEKPLGNASGMAEIVN